MNKKSIIIFAIIFAIITLTASIIITYLRKIPYNDPYTVGNTTGNLYAGGLFCEHEGVVHFANPYDNYSLYVMNIDESNMRKLNDSGIEQINCGGNYVYYFQKNIGEGTGVGYVLSSIGICRVKQDGSNLSYLKKVDTGVIQLIGNNLIFQDYSKGTGVTLQRMGIDDNTTYIINDTNIIPSASSDGTLYYCGNDTDHYLYNLNPTNGTSSLIWEHNMWNPIYQDGYIYYMDLETNYELHKYSLSDGLETVLSKDRLDFFNVLGDYIYYQKSSQDEPALKRIRIDGTDDEIVKEGVYEKINMTSAYVYFNEYKLPTPVYRQSTTGPVSVGTFDNAAISASSYE